MPSRASQDCWGGLDGWAQERVPGPDGWDGGQSEKASGKQRCHALSTRISRSLRDGGNPASRPRGCIYKIEKHDSLISGKGAFGSSRAVILPGREEAAC